ncbi:type II secretion system protein [bacterium]|nr:type II secretion system protein [bacterium]
MKNKNFGFTLPEGATHVETLKDNRKLAFTLAEVLITLGVIGVVAAITLPSFMENVTERVNSERQANIAQKITQAMEHMRAHGLLNTQYSSSESFVDELQKYLKIAKRCDSEHIADCWPTDIVTMSDGEELEVSKAKTGANLSLSTETNNVGLILSDGASIILNYNPASETIDVGTAVYEFPEGGKSLPVGGGKTKQFPYTTTVTGAIDFVMDVNGSKKPNSEVNTSNRDIRSFKIASFSKGELSCEEKGGFEVLDVGCVIYAGKLSLNDAVQTCLDMGGHLSKNFELVKMNLHRGNCWTSNDPMTSLTGRYCSCYNCSNTSGSNGDQVYNTYCVIN